MKVSKKALIVAATFSVALNIHGCAYGPPPEEDNSSQIEVEDSSSSANEISYDTYMAKGHTEENLEHE